MRQTRAKVLESVATARDGWGHPRTRCPHGAARCGRFSQFVMFTGLLALLLTVAGCGGRSADDREKTQVTKSATDGPVEVQLTVSSPDVQLNKPTEAVVEVTAKSGVTVEIESFRQALADSDKRFEYRVTKIDEETAKPAGNGKLRWRSRYRLEFFLPGEYELPPAHAKYLPVKDQAGSQAGGGKGAATTAATDDWHEVATEPVTVTVRDPRAAPPTDQQLRQVTTLDPLALPSVWSQWWWVGLLLATALVVVVALVLRAAARRSAVAEPPVPADVWARRQIAALLGEDLVGKGRIQEFYYRLSDIVRGYIERRFAISAPEMTTEEFLATASADRRFDRSHTEQLDRFLGACDMVKYARYKPGTSEIDGMLNEAKRFIEDTRQRVAPDGGSSVRTGEVQERAA